MFLFKNILNINFDVPTPWGIYFQDSATPQMEGLVELHDNIMYYLVLILFAVAWIMLSIVRNFIETKSPISHKYLNHGTLIELIWTITPAVILILIAFPSFKLLYLMDEVNDSSMSVLAEGFLNGGPKSYILNKKEDTYYTSCIVGQKNPNIFTTLKNKDVINPKFKAMLVTNSQCSNFHTKVKAASSPHNHEVISVIIGSLLGDGYANSRSV